MTELVHQQQWSWALHRLTILLLLLLAAAACEPLPAPLAGAIMQLRRVAEQYISLADSPLPAHAHLEAADRDTMRKEAGAALEWLNEKVALQAQVRQRLPGGGRGWRGREEQGYGVGCLL
jgi:hypothetical protein